jgi:hypothetical protein
MLRWRGFTRVVTPAVLVVSGLVSCGGIGGGTTSLPAAATTVVETSTTDTPETTPATSEATTTSMSADAAPSVIRGTWRTELEDPNADSICLSLGANNYSLAFCGLPGGGGTLSVQGDTITFVSSMLACPEGVGVYRWEIDGDGLTFTELDPPDPCADRRSKLEGHTYTR